MRYLKFSIVSLAALAVATGSSERLFSRPAAGGPAAPAVVQSEVPAPGPAATAPAPIIPPPASADLALLQADLAEVVARANLGAQLGVLVVSLDRGDTLYALNPDVALAPASNMKLYSTAAALYYLGPEFRYTTYVLGTGEVVDGVLEGDLILYGTGDPSISSRMLPGSLTPLRALADTLLARGIREVRGDLVGDGSYFDAEWLGRGWSPDNLGAWYSAPVGALSIAENVASVRVLPGQAPGTPARITTTPGSRELAVINRTTTVPSGQTLIRFEHDPQGLVVTGRIARNHAGLARSMPVVDPTNFTAAVFRNVLAEQGIEVRGRVRTVHDATASAVTLAGRAAGQATSPHPRVLAIHLSPTLAELIAVTNQISHNLFAESLLKTVGRVALGEGSFEAGSRAVRYFLECEAGVDSAAIAIVDGSGLSPLNRVSARTTIQLLDLMTRNAHWEVFLASLPEAGRPRPGGLQRMHGTRAERNLRAKTGTIRTVSSLSGYVRTADGELLAFSILANNLPASAWAQKRIEDQIGARLADFQRPRAAEPPQPVLAGSDEQAPAADTAPSPSPVGEAAVTEEAERAPTPRPPAAPAAGRSHEIRPGDTLDGIARRYGTTVRELERANPGIDPRRLRPGQTVRLPG